MSYTIIQPNDVRFTLIYNDDPHIIDMSPDKWSDHEFSNKRDLSLWGVMRSYATDVEFVGESADLIRSVFFTDGVDALISLKIETLNRSTWQYETIYTGDLDLSTFEDLDNRVTCNIIDGGLSAKLQARRNVKYDIDFNNEDPEIAFKAVDVPSFITISLFGGGRNQTGVDPSNQTRAATFSSGFGGSSDVVRGLSYQDQTYLTSINITDSTRWGAEKERYILFNDTSFNVNSRAQGYFILRLRFLTAAMVNAGFKIAFVGIDNYSNNIHLPQIFYDSKINHPSIVWEGSAFTSIVRFDFSNVDLQFKAGFKYLLYIYSDNINQWQPANGYASADEGSITLKWDTTIGANHIVKAKHPKDLFSNIFKKINNDIDADVVSDLLDENYNLLITTGDAIRQLPNAKIKTSFDDFYKSINAVLNCGFGFDESRNPIIESKSEFFKKDNDIIDFGDVIKVKKIPLTQVMISSISAGYSAQDYEIEKGIDEFNQGQEYTIDQTRVQNKLDIKSIYRADQYGIDTVRIKEINKSMNATETDANTDNDIWFVLCKKNTNAQGYFEPMDKNDIFFIQLNGSTTINRNSFINYLISPKNNIFRHFDYIKSTFFGQNKGFLDFQSSDRNVDLMTIENSDSDTPIIYEKESVSFDDYNINRLFYPIIIQFETHVKPDLQKTIEMWSNGICSFNFNGGQIKGFIFSIDLNANRGSSSVVQLILSPDTDLNLLF